MMGSMTRNQTFLRVRVSGEVGARGERRWGGWAVREGMLGAAGRAMAGFYRRIPTSLATEQCLRTGKGLAHPPPPACTLSEDAPFLSPTPWRHGFTLSRGGDAVIWRA